MDDRGTAAYLQRRINPAEQAYLEVRRRKRAPIEYDDEHPSAASFYVPSLPGQPASSTLIQFAGHLPFSAPGDKDRKGKAKADSDGKNAHAFWYLTKARHVAEKQVLVVWFNGGPGCSSFDGALMEIGPLRMDLSKSSTSNEPDAPPPLREAPPGTAWNEYANVLFLDQPTGTGYSYGDSDEYVHELDAAANNVVHFLSRWYSVFPEFRFMPLYLAGESFAGQYIPYVADAILSLSQLQDVHLAGVMIGNGWVDPKTQYLAYHEFAFGATPPLVEEGSATGKKLLDKVAECNRTLQDLDREGGEGVPVHVGLCEGILSYITDSTVQTVNSQKMCLNMYDVRLVDTFPACGMTWPPDLATLTPYLSRPDVKAAFHASRKDGDWRECDGRVGAQMWTKASRPSVQLVPGLLERGVKVLFFSGDQDLICTHVGTERMIENLHWNGERGWTDDSQTADWSVRDEPAGTWRSERNLTYVKLANASHMAPYDVPFAAHDMLLRFLDMNFLAAAGPASKVPSRVGDETESILGTVRPDGSVANSTSDSTATEDTIAGEGQGTAAEVDRGGAGGANQSPWNDSVYDAGSAAVIIILVAVAVGCWICFRRRLRRTGKLDVGGRQRAASRPGRSRRSGGAERLPGDEGPHELDELVVDGGAYDEQEADAEEGRSRVPYEVRRPRKGKAIGKAAVAEEEAEVMFALGGSDEEEGSGGGEKR